jgi:hypothetical protein
MTVQQVSQTFLQPSPRLQLALLLAFVEAKVGAGIVGAASVCTHFEEPQQLLQVLGWLCRKLLQQSGHALRQMMDVGSQVVEFVAAVCVEDNNNTSDTIS